MASNSNPPVAGLLGPGGVPLALPSNFVCPICNDRPKIATMPGVPPGTPECIMAAAPGDLAPSLRCIKCWGKFWDSFTRLHAPELMPIADGVGIPEKDD